VLDRWLLQLERGVLASVEESKPLAHELLPYVTFGAAIWLAWHWLQDPNGWWQLLGLVVYLAIGITLARTSGNPAEDALGIVLVWPLLIVFVVLWQAHRWSNDHELVEIAAEWGNDAVTKLGELILWTRPPRRRKGMR
jgi:hypothetical protein